MRSSRASPESTSTDVLLYLPAILVPLALLLAYAAGNAVFRSLYGGVALAAVQVANFGLARREDNLAGTGFFETTTQPQAASHLLLVPAIVALAFAFLRDGGGIALLCLGAASMGLTLVHPSYTPFVAMLLLGFLLARLVLVRTWEPLLTRATIALGAITAPLVLFLVLFYPVIRSSSSVTPSTSLRDHELANYGSFVTKLGPWFGMSPEAIARAGPVVVAGLIAIPLAAFAARRLWAALVLGGSVAVLVAVLVPPLFTILADVFSLSQARRLPEFLPVACRRGRGLHRALALPGVGNRDRGRGRRGARPPLPRRVHLGLRRRRPELGGVGRDRRRPRCASLRRVAPALGARPRPLGARCGPRLRPSGRRRRPLPRGEGPAGHVPHAGDRWTPSAPTSPPTRSSSPTG